MFDLSPYARQIALPEVGEAGQARFRAADVLVVGAGGLGCPVLTYLATAGIGALTVMDPDRVERSNLHRQPLFAPRDIGARKVEAAAQAIRRLAPEVRITARAEALGASTVATAIATADVVVDAADSFAASYILSDACLVAGKPLISASALGLGGYVGGFCGGGPSLRAVFPDLPEQAATCATSGVLGPLVGMLGAAQAQMVLQLLLDCIPRVTGQMLRFDMGGLRTSGFRFDAAPEPQAPLRFVPRPGAEDLVIDLRGVEEAPEMVTPSARRIAPQEIGQVDLPEGRRITLACASGLRAWRAARILQAQGYDDLVLHAVQAS